MTRGNSEFTLSDVLDESRRSRGSQLAIVDGDVRLTYVEFAARVEGLAAGLSAAGTAVGDRIAWVGMNSFRVLELVMAAERIGAMVCPVNWRSSSEELGFVLTDLDPVVAIHDEMPIDGGVRAALPADRWVDLDRYEQLVTTPSPPPGGAPSEPSTSLVIMYTAAHDGQPNGVMLTRRGLYMAGLLHGMVNGVYEEHPVFVAAGPLYHVATLMGVVATFVAGGTNVFLPKVDATAVCRAIASERATWTYMTGPSIPEVIDAAVANGADLSSLFVPDAYVKADDRWNGVGRRSTAPWSRHPGGFGQTEATGVLAYVAFAVGASGQAGRPSPLCQVRIVDVDDHELGVGEVGEIVARGPIVGNGYWNRAEVNERRWRAGWWHTNDLGRREADGSLTFVGPKTRMIKSAKENIYPAEVERCLTTHPAIADAAVIGVPDEVWEQSVKALVVLTPGSSLSADDVVAHCRERIASYKKPRFVEFVESLPRHGFALDRDELDRRFGGGGYVGTGR
jgi:acyl-CoA synthetase (AMP-forming)/AMP-acid ligase II